MFNEWALAGEQVQQPTYMSEYDYWVSQIRVLCGNDSTTEYAFFVDYWIEVLSEDASENEAIKELKKARASIQKLVFKCHEKISKSIIKVQKNGRGRPKLGLVDKVYLLMTRGLKKKEIFEIMEAKTIRQKSNLEKAYKAAHTRLAREKNKNI
jgi:hypothetical protein